MVVSHPTTVKNESFCLKASSAKVLTYTEMTESSETFSYCFPR
uniref:Uncharacterized protein n=1 Tax=Anguilla anguilla TaxID=7936 RepID=A0A0E9TG11_ANGAN